MLIKKITFSFFNIFLILLVIFFVLRLAPGDPVLRILGPNASHQEIMQYRSQLGLDLPLSDQLISYLGNLFQANLGTSLFKGQSVTSLIKQHFPPTLIIAFWSIMFSSILGVFFGVASAINQQGKIDNFIRILSLLTLSFPIFSLAPILVLIFSIQLRWFPVSEWSSLKHAILPIMTLVFPLGSIITRITRNKFLEEINAPWVLVLTAKGMKENNIILKVLRVCLPTILNIVAIQLSIVLAGTMITETIFDIPGMGMLLFESIQNRDYPVVQGVIIYTTVIYFLVYFFIDLINERIDPRIK